MLLINSLTHYYLRFSVGNEQGRRGARHLLDMAVGGSLQTLLRAATWDLMDASQLLRVGQCGVAKHRDQVFALLQEDRPQRRLQFLREAKLLVECGQVSVGEGVGRGQHLLGGRHGAIILRIGCEGEQHYQEEGNSLHDRIP